MSQTEELKKALDELHKWTLKICENAGLPSAEGEKLWTDIQSYPGLLQEYAYYHDTGDFLCQYKIEGFTVADILIWQMDHFRSHMDREDRVNRYDNYLLVYNTFKTMIELEKNPENIKAQFYSETGTDLSEGWTLY